MSERVAGLTKHQRYKRRLQAAGLCEHCGKTPMPGYAVCEQRLGYIKVSKIMHQQSEAGIFSKVAPATWAFSERAELLKSAFGDRWLDLSAIDDAQVKKLNRSLGRPRSNVNRKEPVAGALGSDEKERGS